MKLDIKDLDKLQNGIQDLVQKGVQKGVDGLNKGIDYINNLDGSNPAASMNKSVSETQGECTNCGAKLNLDTDADVIVCEYCGTSYDNKKGNATVNSILNFVEKQQERAERDKEEKRALRLERRKQRRKHRIVSLIIIIVVAAVAYYIYTANGGSIPTDSEFGSMIQNAAQSLKDMIAQWTGH